MKLTLTSTLRTTTLTRRQALRIVFKNTDVRINKRTTTTEIIRTTGYRPLSLPLPASSPTNMTTPTLPPLTMTNAKIWRRMLQAVAHDLHLDTLLDASHTAPQEPERYAEYKRQQERLTVLILTSLPEEITSTLTDDQLKLPPYLLTQHVINTVTEYTAVDHSLLESKARNTRLSSLDDAEDYILRHRKIRISMCNANYPQIGDESTTVNFLIHGIQDVEALHHTHDMMIQIPPPTISAFATRLHRIINSIQERQLRAPHYAHTRIPRSIHTKWQPHRWHRNKPHKNEPARQWCTYHNSSTHSNRDCRAQKHNRQPSHNAHSASVFPMIDTSEPQYNASMDPSPTHAQPRIDLPDPETQRKSYILDSGAHPTHLTQPHTHTRPLTTPRYTRTADNRRHSITHSGPVQIPTQTMQINISDAIVTPTIKNNLVSVHSLACNHGPVTFTPSKAYINTNDRHSTQPIASFRDGLYVIDNKPPGFPDILPRCNNTNSTSTKPPHKNSKRVPPHPMTTRSRTQQQTHQNSKSKSTHTPIPDTPSQHTRSKTKTRNWDRPWRTSPTTKPIQRPQTTAPPRPHTSQTQNRQEQPPKMTTQPNPPKSHKPNTASQTSVKHITTTNQRQTQPTQPSTLPLLLQRTPTTAPTRTPQIVNPISAKPRTFHPLYEPDPDDSPHPAHDLHLKLGHPNPQTMRQMCRHKRIPALAPYEHMTIPDMTCSACAIAKIKAAPHKPSEHDHQIGEHISSDVCGPLPITSKQGNRYFVTFIDTKTRYITVYFINNRTTIPNITVDHMEYIHTMQGKYPRFFRSDNAREYTSSTLKQHLSIRVITHITTAPYTPQQNSIAERINHTLMDTVRATLAHSRLDDSNWQYAMMDAVFKRNLTLHATTQKIPHTEWHQTTPHIDKLFAFGQIGHIPVAQPKTKLDNRGTLVRYLAALDQDNILVSDTTTGQTTTIPALDFHPYITTTDPTSMTTWHSRPPNISLPAN